MSAHRQSTTNVPAWEINHICQSFFPLHGFFITQAEFDLLISLLNCHNRCVGEVIDYNHMFYLYSYAIAVYGYLPTATPYSSNTQGAVDTIAKGYIPQISLIPNLPGTFIPSLYFACKII